MPADLPPNLVGTPAYSERRFVKEQEKDRRRRDEERKRAQDADLRIKDKQSSEQK